MNISASNTFILCFISLLVGYLMRYVTEQKDKFNSIDQLSKTTAFLSSNDHSFADINYTADNTLFINTNEDSEAYTNFIGSIKQLENMAKSDPLVDANYQENIYKYGVNLTNVAKEVDRIRKRMQAGRTNSNAQVLDRIYDSIDQLFNLTSFSSNDYIKLLKHRLEETQSSLLDSQKQNQILLLYLQQLKINTPDYHRYIQRLYDERISISNWRAEWDVQLNRTIRKFELDRAIMNSKLMEFGYIYDDELHTVRQLTKDDKAIDINAVNKVIRKTNNNMKSWSLVSVLNHTYCADDKVKKEKENSEYNSIFNPKETWRKDSTYLWTDSTTFFKDQFHPLHIDESEGPTISSIYTNLLTILVTYSDKYPTECIASIRKFCPTVNIQPISIGINYTDIGGQAIYNELMTINTTYVLILDHTVRFNRYTKVDILIYSLMKKYVDVVAGSEEYNDILYPRCYRMVNKFGKVKYQRGYHNGFGFYFKTPNQYIGVAGQICYRTSSYIMTSTDLLKRVWKKNYPLPLAIQAFYFDIQKTHKVGQIPYVTFVHEFSERNTIYKPLQGIEKSVRQAFGQDYNVFIYIDMDNRFTWMPYTPVDFRKRDFPFTMSTQGMVNPLQTIGYSHEYLMLYDKLFHELNIPYAGIAGNLLSAVGFGGLFPWEYDTDFALPIKYKQEENYETAISKLTKGYTKHTTQQQLLNIKDRSNDEDYPGYYCTFLRSIQGHLQEVFNMSRNVFDFTAPGDGCTCGRVTTKADFNSYSDVFDHLINSYQKVIKITTPFKRVKYLGHLVHIPGNWRELLQHNYRYNYFYSNMATNKASAWPMCPAQFKDHPSCLHGEDDIYEYISEMTDEVRYWPDVD